MSWHALEKYFISSCNILRCDSCIQVSTVCKAKQALKPHCDMPAVVTEVVFYSMPWVAKIQFLTLLQNLLWMCNLWASYMQSYKILWLVNNWNVAYLLERSPNLAAFLPVCIWHVLVCDWKVCGLECGGCQECLLEGASSLSAFFSGPGAQTVDGSG